MLLDEMIHESNTFDLKIPLFQIASNESTPIPQLFRQKQPHFELFPPCLFYILPLENWLSSFKVQATFEMDESQYLSTLFVG